MSQASTDEKPKNDMRPFYAMTVDMIRRGQTLDTILMELGNKGLRPDEAQAVYDKVMYALMNNQNRAHRREAFEKIGVGIIFLIIGIVVTLGTYQTAKANGGGTYVVAFGAILGGGYRVLVGVSELL